MRLLSIIFLFSGIVAILTPSKKEDDGKFKLLLREALKTVEQNHLHPRQLNDSFSIELFHRYIKKIDPEKDLLTLKDVKKLEKYATGLDEALIEADLSFFNESMQLLDKAIQKAERWHQKAMEKPLDEKIRGTYWEAKAEKRDYARNTSDLLMQWKKQLWYRNIQYREVITPIDQYGYINDQTRLFYTRKWQKLRKVSREERFHEYLNVILQLHDVQSSFLSQAKREEWNAAFTRSFVGIGVRVEEGENGLPIVSEVIIGGPAWKSGTIKKGDVLLSIDSSALSGLGTRAVLTLLKGKAGSTVRLRHQGREGAIKETTLSRASIELDKATALLLEHDELEGKVGYVYLPRFYRGEKGAASDIRTSVEQLKANGISGMIVDLRDNKGGSAREAIQIMSLFLDEGPLMHSRYRSGDTRTYEDQDGMALYTGALAILVNSRSSSASELLAGTLQDYQRAVVIGTSNTYGKGSIQRFFPLSATENEDTLEFGDLKLTIGHFYTAAGRTPQYRGIQPDILIPGADTYLTSGERVYDGILTPENLNVASCTQSVNTLPPLDIILNKSQKRRGKDVRLAYAEKHASLLAKQQEETKVRLTYDHYLARQEQHRQMEAIRAKAFQPSGMVNTAVLPDALENAGPAQRERLEHWLERTAADPYLEEAIRVINDLNT